MNESQEAFINAISNEMADISMIDLVSTAMKEKMHKKALEGRGGWYKLHEVKNEILIKMLKRHVDKGDMIDVLNFAAMIHVRTELYGDDA